MKYICDNCEKYPCTDDKTKLMLRCPAFSPKPKPMTHFNEIKAMSAEELAKYIDLHAAEAMWCNSPPDDCPPHETCALCILDWLKAPVEVDDG